MNPVLYDIMDKNTPKINPMVVEGTSTMLFKHLPEYLNYRFKSSMKMLSPEVGLEYHGWFKVSPEKEVGDLVFKENSTSLTDPVVQYDLAKNDVFLIGIKMSYRGEPFTLYQYLPYSDDGNLIKLSDVVYHVVPVLSDTVISPADRQVFVRLVMAKLTFVSLVQNFVVDGKRIAGEIINSQILRVNEAQITDNIGKAVISPAIYLTAKYGLKGAFKRYLNLDDIIVVNDKRDISEFPDYIMYESTRIKPKDLQEKIYNGTHFKIGIPRNADVDLKLLNNFIFGIIYTIEVFTHMAPDVVELVESGDVESEMRMWKLAIGTLSFKDSFTVDRMAAETDHHFYMLDAYVDDLIKGKLENAGRDIEDFFDLLAVILRNYNDWTLNAKEFNNTISNRYIDIYFYIGHDIVIGFNRVMLQLNKRGIKKPLSLKECRKIFMNDFSPRLIFKLTKSNAMNLAMNLADYSGDIKYTKITSTLEDQSRGAGVKRAMNAGIPDSAKTLKGEHMWIGSLFFLTKTTYSPQFKMNMFTTYDPHTGKIKTPVSIQNSISVLNKLLTGRSTKNVEEVLEAEVLADIDG